MTVQEHLSSYGVTMEVAKEFIMSNLENLQNIFDVCKQFSVTNDMIAEIVGIDGIDGTGVANFFAQNGIDSDSLGGSKKTVDIVFDNNEITPAFEFSTEWLNGKTLYNVYDDNGDGQHDYGTFTFTNTGYTASEGLVNYNQFSGTYEIVDNGIMYMSPLEYGDNYTYIYVTEILSDQNGEYGFKIGWVDSLDYIPNENEFFLFDSSSAEDFILL